MMKALDHLTIEDYKELQVAHKNDRRIAQLLYVHQTTLIEWKRERGMIFGLGIGRRSRLTDEKRLEIYKQCLSEGYQEDFIADKMLFTIRPLRRWIKRMKEQGHL